MIHKKSGLVNFDLMILIEYMKDKNNAIEDDLSRKPYPCSMFEITVDWRSLIIVEYAKNNFANEILEGKV